MTMPAQRPHRSKQDYATPEVFIKAVKQRLGIQEFEFDFAADLYNTQALAWWSEMDNSLAQSSERWAAKCGNGGWGWLNPPFTDIEPWAQKCAEMRAFGGSIALLVPASVGSNWFRDYVDPYALVLALNGRIPFIPDKPKWLYPKDCILALYSPLVLPGFSIWGWK